MTADQQQQVLAPNIPRLLGEPWLIYDQALPLFLERVHAGAENYFDMGGDAADEDGPRNYEVEDGVAKLNFHGVVGKRLSYWETRYFGMLDLDDFNALLDEAAEDGGVESIDIDFDSPGGSVTGVLETMANVRRVDSFKSVTARTETLMASAAYFIGSQARRVLATESARVGSIGTMATHIDREKWLAELGYKIDLIKNAEGTFKGAGILGISLTKEQREQIQESLQFLHDRSVAMIKERRPLLKDEAMRGQVVFGAESYWQGDGLVTDLI